jgi:methylase of polypeptide subunit release factors
LTGLSEEIFTKPFIIVANLPYIPDEVFYENVEYSVKKWEPSIAFLGGKD